jgi:hypothetical protein
LRLEQAVYGEVQSGGHGLRAFSPGCAIAADLAPMMDLPDAAPPGVSWEPFLTGFAYRDWFVLARTFPDMRARRGGMVVAHALLAPLQELAGTEDIGPVVGCLATAANAIPEPATLDSEHGPAIPVVAATEDLDAVADALAARGRGPAVRIGTQGFDSLVVALWARLWPEMRQHFAFRISFSPSDVQGSRAPVLVCTPAELASRWAGSRVVWPGRAAPVTETARLLAGRRPAGPVLDLGREIGARIDWLDDLPLLVALYDEVGRMAECPQAAISAVRLAARISPDLACGTAAKNQLLGAASRQIRSGAPALILELRNLKTAAFAGATEVWQAVEARILEFRFEPESDGTVVDIIRSATQQGGAVAEWSAAVEAGFSRLANDRSPALPAAFWRLAERNSSSVKWLLQLLPTSPKVEVWLSGGAPGRLSRHAAAVIQDASLRRGWLRLHGEAGGAAYQPAEAVTVQLKVDLDPGFFDGLRAAARLAAPGEVLCLALDMHEERLLDLAAAQVARQPDLLSDVSMGLPCARSVWARAVELNSDAWRGPKEPANAFHAALDDVLEGTTVGSRLIDALARTPLADVGEYPRRAELWARLEPDVAARLLSETANGWLDGLRGGSEPALPDPSLEAAISGMPELDRLLRESTGPCAATAVYAASALGTLSENRIMQWVDALLADRALVSDLVAARFGRLVAERKWRRVADRLADALERGRRDLDPAVREVESLLGFFARWRLRLSPVPADEKWGVLEGVAATLYPSGPDNDGIWARAGGRQEDLRADGNGRTRWGDAISRLRNGCRGLTAPLLLSEMLSDFPSNRELSALLDAFGGLPSSARSKEHR